MKKTFLLIAVAIILGGFTGNILFNKYDEVSAFSSDKIYFIQEGVYSSISSVNSNTKDINPKIILLEDDKYHVYLGIASTKNGAEKINKVYQKKGYSTNIITKKVEKDSFLTNLIQYDILLDSAKTSDDILSIEEVVLSNYEEVVKK